MNEIRSEYFIYSTDLSRINAPEYEGCCIHLLCLAGEGSFIYNEKSKINSKTDATDRTAFVVSGLLQLLETGVSRTEREVSFYADKLNVSPKYLSNTIKRLTGNSVMYLIDQHTVPILVEYLKDNRYSLTQIADLMNFGTLSYFSRYCTMHLGMSPSEYRKTLIPKTQ